MSGGKSREQGYASYDEETDTLIYTSYEKDGSVNRYADNKDGGHSHSHWDSKDDYNNGNKPDQHRSESNKSKNPSTGEVQDNGGCYLTSACMRHFQDEFDDNCYELSILRWFRDNFVSKKKFITMLLLQLSKILMLQMITVKYMIIYMKKLWMHVLMLLKKVIMNLHIKDIKVVFQL